MILSKIRIVFSNKYFHFGILYHYNAIAGDDFSILNIMWLKYSINEKEGVKKFLNLNILNGITLILFKMKSKK